MSGSHRRQSAGGPVRLGRPAGGRQPVRVGAGQPVQVGSGRAGGWRSVRVGGRHPVRLTRRGRVVVGLGLLLGGLLVVAGLLVVTTPPSQAADPANAAPAGAEGGTGGPPVAVVRPGDTLWSVAARHVPSRDAYGMIEEIRRLNDLSGHTIHPGQRLRLPAR